MLALWILLKEQSEQFLPSRCWLFVVRVAPRISVSPPGDPAPPEIAAAARAELDPPPKAFLGALQIKQL